MRSMIYRTLLVTMFLFMATATGFGHGDENHKGKVARVTPKTMMQAMPDSAAAGHDEMAESMMMQHQEDAEAAIQKDIDEIIAETKKSATATVIKVASLGLALIGLVVAYYPRRKGTGSDTAGRGTNDGS